MPIDSISRQQITLSVSAVATIGPDITQVIANGTSGGFTLTLPDFSDGAKHQLEVLIAPADSSGNAVVVSGNAGAFTTSLASNGTTSVLLETQYNGTWFVVSDVSAVSAGSASSAATSAGLAASNASSVATSQNLTQSTVISTAGSVAGSATLSGVSATASVATSQNLSQSANTSSAMSLASS